MNFLEVCCRYHIAHLIYEKWAIYDNIKINSQRTMLMAQSVGDKQMYKKNQDIIQHTHYLEFI